MNHGDGVRSGASGERRERRRAGRSAWVMRTAIVVSALASVLWMGGFAYGTWAAMGGRAGAPPSDSAITPSQSAGDTSPASDKTIHVVALGDSLAHGLGDASGQGFVGDVSARYRQQGSTVIQSNLGIDGLTSAGLLPELEQPSVQSLLRSAHVILISIGGNDLNDAAGLPELNPPRIAAAQAQFDRHLQMVLSTIRKWNATAVIVLVGLYNPYANVKATAQQTDAVVQAWNDHEAAVAAQFPRTIVAQTFDLFALSPTAFLYVDHFHPNQAGYQRIADRIWQDLQTQ